MMMTERSRQPGRRQLMCACCAGTFIAWTLARAHAAVEVVVPVTQEPRHHVRLRNEYLRIIEAIFVPGDQSLSHKHASDTLGLVAGFRRCRLASANDQAKTRECRH
jgi:hypothetical protein